MCDTICCDYWDDTFLIVTDDTNPKTENEYQTRSRIYWSKVLRSLVSRSIIYYTKCIPVDTFTML